ncbi:ABC-2 type transporter permease protein (plasmid) [Rhizobium sp. NXC14]|nr:ABC-2 type transporter permease protein [Rhizobium sp. NXC14]
MVRILSEIRVRSTLPDARLDKPPILYALPVIALTGLAFASLAMVITALAPSYAYFVSYQTLVLTPMLLLCGAVFPITQLPDVCQQAAHFLPLAHAIDLIRPALLGRPAAGMGAHIGALGIYWRRYFVGV